MYEDGWTQQQADAAEPMYKGYLLLVGLNPDKSIIPTKIIDKMWHAHILDTAKYQEDCQKTFGHFIHHFPYIGLRGPADEKKLHDSFEETRRLSRELLSFDIGAPSEKITLSFAATTCEGPNGCSGNTCSPSTISQSRPARADVIRLGNKPAVLA